jgi:hypothetical protein
MKCANCGNKLSCSCQQRTASNGKSCCSQCITAYEASLKPNLTQENQGPFVWDVPHNYYPKK